MSIGIGSVIIGKKVSIGNNTKIGFATIIRAKEISIEPFVTIGSFTIIDSGKIRIGEDARINEQVIIGGMKTHQSGLDLGKRTIIMEYSFINTTMPVKIGDDTGIGGHCLLFTHGSWPNMLEGFPVSFAPITIGKGVWLPWRIFVMPGITIGDKVVIGANSLISKSVDSNCLVAGSPAKVIKENYPPPLSVEERDEKIREVFNGFEKHLQYHGFSIELTETENGTEYAFRNRKKNHCLWFCKNNLLPPELNKNSLLIFDNDEDLHSYHQNKNIMLLNLKTKERLGTTSIGEEFVRFVSRFGIRFNRLD